LLPVGMKTGRLVWFALAAPLFGLLAVVVVLTYYCHRLLAAATAGRVATIGEVPLFLIAGGFVFASAVVVTIQSLRMAGRVAGPEYRLSQALQRIRNGDIGFRVDLRRGDLLTGLARECNELLEWLNHDPPPWRKTGSDVVYVHVERVEESAAAPAQVAP